MNYIKDHNGTFTVISDKVCSFGKEHMNYDLLVKSIKEDDLEAFDGYFNIGKSVSVWSYDNFVFSEGVLTYDGEVISQEITTIILEMIEEGFNHLPMLNFLERLYYNPSYTAITELYTWLAHKSLAITPEGYFLALKAVRVYNGDPFTDAHGRPVKSGDYVDKYSGTYRNNVGDINEMPRRKVNDNRDLGCESGFHVGSKNYVNEFGNSGDAVIICRVDPADVVSVPLDCNCQKIRCSKYNVLSVERTMKIVEDPRVWYDNEIEDLDDDWSDSEAIEGWTGIGLEEDDEDSE